MSEVSALERQHSDAKEHIARRDLALKLYNNREFKKLILEEFCVNDCARYAQSSADPALKPENRADALAIAQASGHLRRYLSVIVTLGNQAEGQMQSLEEAILEARSQEDEE